MRPLSLRESSAAAWIDTRNSRRLRVALTREALLLALTLLHRSAGDFHVETIDPHFGAVGGLHLHERRGFAARDEGHVHLDARLLNLFLEIAFVVVGRDARHHHLLHLLVADVASLRERPRAQQRPLKDNRNEGPGNRAHAHSPETGSSGVSSMRRSRRATNAE